MSSDPRHRLPSMSSNSVRVSNVSLSFGRPEIGLAGDQVDRVPRRGQAFDLFRCVPSRTGRCDYICGALGFCCHRAIRVPEGSSKMTNHPWPGTSFFGAMIFPPAFLIFSWYSSTEFTEM